VNVVFHEFWLSAQRDPKTAEPYVSIGIITPSYNHLVYIGLGLHVNFYVLPSK
jgi:hypothetical protein